MLSCCSLWGSDWQKKFSKNVYRLRCIYICQTMTGVEGLEIHPFQRPIHDWSSNVHTGLEKKYKSLAGATYLYRDQQVNSWLKTYTYISYIGINNWFTFVLECGKRQSSGQKAFCNSVPLCKATAVTFGKNLKLI